MRKKQRSQEVKPSLTLPCFSMTLHQEQLGLPSSGNEEMETTLVSEGPEGFLLPPQEALNWNQPPSKSLLTQPQQQSLHHLLSLDSPGLGFPQRLSHQGQMSRASTSSESAGR